jgi:ferredoxin
MKIDLTSDRCVGHGQCYANAPELFAPDDEGYSTLLVDGDVPAELQAKARVAANSCPEYAITLVD